MTTVNVDDLVVRLRRHHDSLGDGRDCRSQNERAAWYASSRTCADLISGLMNAPADLARVETRLTEVEAQRAAFLAKQSEIEQAIADAPDWQSLADARERDREYDRQRGLRMSLQLLRDGRLLVAPGVTYGRLADLNARIAELTDRRDRAQLQLDALVRQAEALLAAVPVAS